MRLVNPNSWNISYILSFHKPSHTHTTHRRKSTSSSSTRRKKKEERRKNGGSENRKRCVTSRVRQGLCRSPQTFWPCISLSLSFSIHKLLFLHVDDAYICFVLWIWNFYLLFCLIYFLVRSESDCSFGYLWLAIWWNIHWKLNIVDVWVAGQIGLFCTYM